MDGENNGKPNEQMADLGCFPYFWKHPPIFGDIQNLPVIPGELEVFGSPKSLTSGDVWGFKYLLNRWPWTSRVKS